METVTIRRNGLAQEAHKYLDEHGYPPLEDNGHSEVQPDVVSDPFDAGTSHVDVAQRLVKLFGDRIRYVHPKVGWYVWSGSHWKKDDQRQIDVLAKATLRELRVEAAKANDPQLFALARNVGKAAGIRSVLDLAASEAGVRVHVRELDAKPHLLACEDVTVDLRDGSTKPPDPSDLITRCCPVRYDKAATAPLFDRFLEQIQPDEEIRGYLQRLLGGATYGEVREHVLAVFWGKGNNGKSVLADVVSHALGDHARPGPRELLIKQAHEPHPTHITTLMGTRLVVVHETEEGAQLANSKVKVLTGGDELTAGVMRGDFFRFNPTHQLVMLSNYRPKVDATDAAIWRRLQLVPFEVVIAPKDVDTELAKKINAGEAAGVLRWIVRGAVLWHKYGLQPPDIVRDATHEYRQSEDIVGQFLEQCTTPDRVAKIQGSALFSEYDRWAKAEGHEVLDGKAFSKAVVAHGFERRRQQSGTVYLGLELVKHREVEDPRYEGSGDAFRGGTW